MPAILGPERAAPILWAPGIIALFLQENLHAHKIPLLGGIFWIFWGGSADLIFMGAKIFLNIIHSEFKLYFSIPGCSVRQSFFGKTIWKAFQQEFGVGSGAGFAIAVEFSKLPKEGENPGKGHFYLLCQTLACTTPWFKRDLNNTKPLERSQYLAAIICTSFAEGQIWKG